MKMGFFKGIFIGTCAGAAIGIMLDPLTKRKKKSLRKKIERAISDITG